MGRGRIPMELIQKEKARKTTFQKRKNGLMKKVYEFSTLCAVDVCVIIYAPNFEGEEITEPETWPEDKGEVRRIIEKYYNTTIDRHPKIYDVQEYYKERIKKVEAEISKVCKEMVKYEYPTWDESFNAFREEELRMFGSMLDVRLDACNQRMNMLKGDCSGSLRASSNSGWNRDIKGKSIAEYEKLTPYLAPYPNSNFNLMPQPNLFPLPMSDENSFSFWPDLQLGQSSQPSMLNYGQNEMTSWVNDGSVYHKFDVGKDDGVENNQNSYYNGIAQSYPITMKPRNLPPPGFQFNGYYDTDTYQTHLFDFKQERK